MVCSFLKGIRVRVEELLGTVLKRERSPRKVLLSLYFGKDSPFCTNLKSEAYYFRVGTKINEVAPRHSTALTKFGVTLSISWRKPASSYIVCNRCLPDHVSLRSQRRSTASTPELWDNRSTQHRSPCRDDIWNKSRRILRVGRLHIKRLIIKPT